MSNVPQNQQDLREMVYHTDARVTAMEGQITTIGNNQLRSEQKLDQMMTMMNTPKHVNYAAWVGVGLTTVAMLIGGIFGLTSYVTLTQGPLIADQELNRQYIEEIRQYQRETHYEFGVAHERRVVVDREINRLWDHIHALEKVDKDLIEKAAAAEIARRAIGDYVRDIDQFGSRKWVGKAIEE